ncbi:hypothetical protein GE061_004719 [Apolygus lucorum]|uniref:Band 7 domain-containing protein n=1 Tax=Apolygus lucorum TaxID=248454 RepID=A0A8S9X1Y2_APOLU|nr:hypothetical protein GE061_004719 [Apolygus lucorum]
MNNNNVLTSNKKLRVRDKGRLVIMLFSLVNVIVNTSTVQIGIFFILPCIDNYARVDLRTRTYDVPPQEVLTKDSVTVSVDAVVYYRVSNATVSVANVANAHHSTRLLAQTTLRNVLGTRPLHEILSDREAISQTMQGALTGV